MSACLSHFSHVQLFVTPWTIAHQAPRSMGFSRKEYWSGLPRPPPRDLPNPVALPSFNLNQPQPLSELKFCLLNLCTHLTLSSSLTLSYWCFPGGSVLKNPPASTGDAGDTGLIPGFERSLEEEMATHSSILSWKISWAEEPGGLQSMGSQRVGHDWATNTYLLNEGY